MTYVEGQATLSLERERLIGRRAYARAANTLKRLGQSLSPQNIARQARKKRRTVLQFLRRYPDFVKDFGIVYPYPTARELFLSRLPDYARAVRALQRRGASTHLSAVADYLDLNRMTIYADYRKWPEEMDAIGLFKTAPGERNRLGKVYA